MIDNRRFIRDETRPLTWLIGYMWDGRLGTDIFSIREATSIKKYFKERYNIELSIEKQNYIPDFTHYPYQLSLSFTNEADEAEFIIRASI